MRDDLRLIVMDNCQELGEKVNREIQAIRNTDFDFRIPVSLTRFNDGEGKATLNETIRGKDVYILCDTHNYGIGYEMYGMMHYMSPDEHFQDIKRIIYATMGHAGRISVVMPFLYESRQHRRKSRESLDCSGALRELEALGVKEIITFDAHDPNVQNAIPLLPFDNFYPTNDMLRAFMEKEDCNFSNIKVISPDSGALARARFLADAIGVSFASFEKSRDTNKVVSGLNPIVSDRYLGDDVSGMDIIVTDDMLASGGSLIRVARELKERGARRMYFFVTFALFTKGIKEFDEAFHEGLFDGVYATNLNYVPEEILNRPWFNSVDCSGYLARIIDCINRNESVYQLIEDNSAVTAYRTRTREKKN